MKINKRQVTALLLTELDSLDPVAVIAEDLGPNQGKITITCFGKAWTAYWGGMGTSTIAEFFCGCDERYIAKNLSDTKSSIYDIDAIRDAAEENGIECWRDDPWNDYEFMAKMYGSDMYDWSDKLPKKANPEYRYLCRIIAAVQQALKPDEAKRAA